VLAAQITVRAVSGIMQGTVRRSGGDLPLDLEDELVDLVLRYLIDWSLTPGRSLYEVCPANCGDDDDHHGSSLNPGRADQAAAGRARAARSRGAIESYHMAWNQRQPVHQGLIS
jgi:hypothetical protein